MVFTKFVEIGRVCMINYGPDAGKLCTIINIVDGNFVLVDGPYPVTGIKRQIIGLKRVTLTDIKVKIGINARLGKLVAAWKSEDVLGQWKQTPTAKLLEKREKRANMNDFDRFKLMAAKKQRSAAIRAKVKELSKK